MKLQPPAPSLPRLRAEVTLSRGVLSEVDEIKDISATLLKGTSLSPLNREIFLAINKEAEAFGAQPDPVRVMELKEWFFHTLLSQNYCSPTAPREGGIIQEGLFAVPPWTKYLRSEMGSSMFGESYEREAVIIRSRGSDSFSRLAAEYVVHSKTKESCALTSLSTGEADAAAIRGDMLFYSPSTVEKGIDELSLFSKKAAEIQFEGGVYLKVQSTLTPAQIETLRALTQKLSIQILIEEPYNPCGAKESPMAKVRFLHDQSDPLRYQLIQDAASMGYRVDQQEVARYLFSAGILKSHLNTEREVTSSLAHSPYTETIKPSGEDRAERDRDFNVLLSLIKNTQAQLAEVVLPSSLSTACALLVGRELVSLQEGLESHLRDPRETTSSTARIFHESYYRARVAVQHAVKLGAGTLEELESKIEAAEGGVVITTNSGMSAARAVISALREKGVRAYSTPHYWETDFYIENAFSHNPHYPNPREAAPSKLSMLSASATRKELAQYAEKIVQENQVSTAGQMVCADRSISPFFFTKHFDLQELCAQLSERSSRLVHPLYLVVDPTLDFSQVNKKQLFPQGLPKNIILISTQSHAKLHQYGLDLVPGGSIQIHRHSDQRARILELKENLSERLEREGSRQDPYRLNLIYELFYRHYLTGTMPQYLDYMVEKRRRNTAQFVGALQETLGTRVQGDGIQGSLVSAQGDAEFLLPDKVKKDLIHKVTLGIHYDPHSALHSYLKISEPPGKSYIAKEIFEEIKARVFALAASQGINLGDGTSWGFTTTRIDYYMHTMRIATGLEHRKTLQRLGCIVGSVLSDLCDNPQSFVRHERVLPLTKKILTDNTTQVRTLAELIPHSPGADVLEDFEKRIKEAGHYSRIVTTEGKLSSFIFAYPEIRDEEKVLYLSKAATALEFRGRGHFKRMLHSVAEQAKGEDISKIVLQTSASKSNGAVISAYEKCGFRVTGLKVDSYQNGWPLVMVVMTKPLDMTESIARAPFIPLPSEVYESAKREGSTRAVESYAKKNEVPFLTDHRE